MEKQDIKIEFTGEFFVPGQSGERIEADHLERYTFASQYVRNKSVLDIACGAGYSAPLLINAGAVSYDGVDINEQLIEYSKSLYAADNINYHLGDICSFNNGKTYDIITCFETIEHVVEYELALKNLYTLLNYGGILLISSPNRPITSPRCLSLQDKPKNDFHTQEFIPEELLTLLKKYNFVAGEENVFGQRQRKVYSYRLINKLAAIVYGNPDKKTSPVVKPVVENMEPRYFIVVAKKQ